MVHISTAILCTILSWRPLYLLHVTHVFQAKAHVDNKHSGKKFGDCFPGFDWITHSSPIASPSNMFHVCQSQDDLIFSLFSMHESWPLNKYFVIKPVSLVLRNRRKKNFIKRLVYMYFRLSLLLAIVWRVVEVSVKEPLEIRRIFGGCNSFFMQLFTCWNFSNLQPGIKLLKPVWGSVPVQMQLAVFWVSSRINKLSKDEGKIVSSNKKNPEQF